MAHAAILLAAGTGSRMRGPAEDKTLLPVLGRPLFFYALDAFLESGAVDEYFLVYRDPSQREKMEKAMANRKRPIPNLFWVKGGKERQDSVSNALEATPATTETVYIHDCARPLPRPEIITAMKTMMHREKAVCLAHRVIDTIKTLHGTVSSRDRKNLRERNPSRVPEAARTFKGKLEDMERDRLWAMETPQVFDRDLILRAYREVREKGNRVTDDAAAFSLTGAPLTLLENPYPNPKLTRAADLPYIEFLIRQRDSH